MNLKWCLSDLKLKLRTFILFCFFFIVLLIINNTDIKLPTYVIYKNFPLIKSDEPHFKSNYFRDTAMQIYKNRSDLVSYEQFFAYIENPVENFCFNKTTIGGKWTIATKITRKNRFREGDLATNKKNGWYIDGDKIVCFDQHVFDSNDCVIISIGISNDWSFDDHIVKYGCKVFAFDHTISQRKFNRSKNIFFYPYGIGKKDSKKGSAKIITLSKMFNIAKEALNKTDLEISYLKIDVEGAELGLFEYLNKTNREILRKIKQIGMEIHPQKFLQDFKKPNRFYKEYFKDFMFLEQNRFALFYSAMNPVPYNRYYSTYLKKYINGFYELVWGRW
ncbi:UNVERIFIED_CONTAM: hypothetical protein RMT77_013107 [Armadillidium vulgare]